MTYDPPDVTRLRVQAQYLEDLVNERTRLLVRAKRTWEGTFDAIVDPLAIIDRSYRIVRTNLALASHVGMDVRTLNGRLCHEVIFRRDRPCDGCPTHRAFSNATKAEGEVRDAEKDRVYRLWSFPMSSGDGEAPGVPDQAVCHYKDVTDEVELQRQLVQSEKMAAVGTLAGGVAHEINNPLGAILAFAQIGLEDAPAGSSQRDFFNEIEQAALRCKRIVESLLNYSRPSRGERRPVHLSQIVDQAVFLCQHQFGKSGVTVAVEHDPGAPPVLADGNQIQQVVVNLLANAYGAMPDGGSIRVETRAAARESVTLAVTDTGHGISERHLEKIFEPFFTTRPEGKGTGLGLFISYGILKDHGATIEVRSRVAEGSTFEIRFPWPAAAEQESRDDHVA